VLFAQRWLLHFAPPQSESKLHLPTVGTQEPDWHIVPLLQSVSR
jgi:hypothetical protein